jgi:RNA polymerase sigma factor (sigma-70 family)
MAMLPVQAPPEQGSVEQIRPRLAGGPFRGLAARTDERLVSIAKEGDERAFEILYERHSAAILRYCRSLLRSTQEAEDVKQEVFVLAISALRRGAEPDAFRPWLYRVAHNACMSHLRMRRPVLVADNGVLVGAAAAAEPVDGHREELRQLLDDIGKLPDVQRGALLLREMDGFSYEQVGEVLGLPLSTVRASIFRARRTLQGLAEARDADCEAIQSELSRLADRRGRRGRHITSHLNVCTSCRDFRDGLRRRPTVLGGVAPVSPPGALGLLVAVKGKLFGGAAAGSGTTAAIATTGGGAGAVKIAAVAASSIALIAGAGVEADRAIEHSRQDAASTPAPAVAARDGNAAPARGPVFAPAAAGAATGIAGAPAAPAHGGRLVVTAIQTTHRNLPARAHARETHATSTPAAAHRAGDDPSAPAAGAEHGQDSAPGMPGTRDHEHSGASDDDGSGGHDGRSDDALRARGDGDEPNGTASERAERAVERPSDPQDDSGSNRPGTPGSAGDSPADAPAPARSGSSGSSTPKPSDDDTSGPAAPAPAPPDDSDSGSTPGGSAPPDAPKDPQPAPNPVPAPAPEPEPKSDAAPTPDPSPVDPQVGDVTETAPAPVVEGGTSVTVVFP